MNSTPASLFGKLTHGVYVIGVAGAGRRNAFTAAWVMQVSFDPPLLALSINPRHDSYTLLKAGGSFSVNVLRQGQEDLAGHFAKPVTADKLASVAWCECSCGAPILEDALAWFECTLVGEYPAGDHQLALGRVIHGEVLAEESFPLNYTAVAGIDQSAKLLPARLEQP